MEWCIFYIDSEAWFVYEIENHDAVQLLRSSLTVKECFIYFDESRCRGSDLSLLSIAVGLVTLEPKMTKDKFLQSCARMRKLGPDSNNQSLILAGTAEVVSKDTTVKQVLAKIIQNTAAMTRKGLILYHQHGVNFDSFPNPIDDDITLEGMYAGHVTAHANLSDFLDAAHENEVMSDSIIKLVTYCKEVGKGSEIDSSTGQLSQECEQELEKECEEEIYEEREVPKQKPAAQQDWPFAEAFHHPGHLFSTLFIQLKGSVAMKLRRLSHIKWSENIYCTPNF